MSVQNSPLPLILSLDDEASIQEILQDFFGLLNYRFVAFSSAASALAYLTDHEPDLIITDLQLKESDGLHFASQCKIIRRSTPILLLTGVSLDPRGVNTILGREVDAIQSKTKPLGELQQVVTRLIERK